jgi:hypothetical protein
LRRDQQRACGKTKATHERIERSLGGGRLERDRWIVHQYGRIALPGSDRLERRAQCRFIRDIDGQVVGAYRCCDFTQALFAARD